MAGPPPAYPALLGQIERMKCKTAPSRGVLVRLTPKSPRLALTHAAGACPGLKRSTGGGGHAPETQERTGSFPARLQDF